MNELFVLTQCDAELLLGHVALKDVEPTVYKLRRIKMLQ
jgi:hypothetical protein